jgi:RHS repeat-associated protein
MKRAALLAVLFLLASAALADTPFYTQPYWYSFANWTVRSGNYDPPVAGYRLTTDPEAGNPSRLDYAGSVPGDDYTIQSSVSWQTDPFGYPQFSHYLRINGAQYYRVDFNPGYNGWIYVTVCRGYTYLASTQYWPGTYGTATVTSSIHGSALSVSISGSPVLSVSDSTIASGGLGVGVAWSSVEGYGLGSTTLSVCDTSPPTTPTNLAAVPYPARVNLSWSASTDNVGVAGYSIYRRETTNPQDDALVGTTTGLSFTDLTVANGLVHWYSVEACDASGNKSSKAVLQVTLPAPAQWAPETGGPVEYAATWGAGPETIGLLNGVLSVRIPLAKFTHRSSGPGFQMAAVWNSQFWSWDGTGTRMSALDIGYGLGFNFIIAAAYPVYSGTEIDHIEFLSSDGILHKLLPTDSSKRYFKPQDSTYLLWDNLASPDPTLTFKDGTVWRFGCVSQETAANGDGGTRYPTELRDTNGNLITVTYEAAAGMSGSNSSGRIYTAADSQTTYLWYWYTVNGSRHLNYVRHSDGYQQYLDATFTYETRTDIVSPSDFTAPLNNQPITRVVLREINFTGLMAPYKFEYNTSAEITKITLPQKGYFRYDYATASFSSPSRQTREIAARYASADGTNEQAYTFSHPAGDTSLSQHSQTTLADPPGNKKIWYFTHDSSAGWDNGLNTKFETYQGLATTPLRKAEMVWTQDDPNSPTLKNPRVYSTTTTLEDGATTSKVEQDVDGNGNVTQVREYGHGDTTPFRASSTTYLSTDPYTSRRILNRPSQITVCAGAAGCGTPASVTNITYDSTGLSNVPGITQHDAGYSTGFTYRGNHTVANANGLATYINYDIGGNAVSTSGAVSQTVAYVPGQATQVSQVQGGGNTTSYSYYSDLSLASVTGSNSDTAGFNYSQRRPVSTTLPVGGQVNYAYPDGSGGSWGQPWTYPFWRQDTTPMGRVSKTFYDGFGRAIKTAVRESTSPEVWIYTETQYDACSCNPMGRAVKQSRPYRGDGSGNPSETVYWIETAFDALGRTVSISNPYASGQTPTTNTSYAYSIVNDANWKGTLTTITDPLGKQKRYLYDAFGRLLRVDEQNAGGTLVETARYTYDTMGRLLTVRMGKINETTFKQTRTFVYNTKGQLVSAANPENGTVTYTYASDGLLETKTDAKLAVANQKLWYVYDSYKRLVRIEHEADGQRTTKTTFSYDYDAYVATTNAVGRMTWAANDGYTWHFAYDAAGRVVKQTLQLPWSLGALWAQGAYAYDTDGRMTSLAYPGVLREPSYCCVTGDVYSYSYDSLGRPVSASGPSGTLAQNATYNAAGQITAWQEVVYPSLTYSATRQYDSARGWLTGLNVKDWNNQNLVNLAYRYFGDGRVSGVYDSVNPTLSALYQYDSLNRLSSTTAGTIADPNATQWQVGTTNWALQWTYDEFGNRLSQAKVPNSPGSPPEITLSYGESTNRITTSGYSYDLNGNLTAMPGITGIAWDVLDRMSGTSVPGTTRLFSYDAFGRRMDSGTYPYGHHIYFYDTGGRLLAEYANVYSGATPTKKYEYLAGQQLGQYKDRVGSVRNTNGGISSHYYPFGEEITSTANDRYKFAETYRDADSGLDYALNRYYAASIGRFLSVDSAQADPTDAQSWNRYAYTQNDPVNFVDPTGLTRSAPYTVCEWSLTFIGEVMMGRGEGTETGDLYGLGLSHCYEMLNYFEASQGKKKKPTPLELLELRRESILDELQGAVSPDSAFSADILDCVAGRESEYRTSATNGSHRGLYQFNQSTWNETGTDYDYSENVRDVKISTSVMTALLNERLIKKVGLEKYSAHEYTEADVKVVIKNTGPGTDAYADQIWNCAQKMKAGDLTGALAAIGKR